MPLTGTNVSWKIRTQYKKRFAAINLKKKTFNLIKTLLVLINKSVAALDELRMNFTKKKVKNCGKNYSIKTRLNLNTRFVWEAKNNTIISVMSRCNVLQRTGPDFCATDNFHGTFAHFHFMIFTQERISMYVDSCP